MSLEKETYKDFPVELTRCSSVFARPQMDFRRRADIALSRRRLKRISEPGKAAVSYSSEIIVSEFGTTIYLQSRAPA